MDVLSKLYDDENKYCKCTKEPMWTIGGKCVTCGKPKSK